MILYHYTEFEYGLDDILNCHVKVATLDSLNDPYEWVPVVSSDDGSDFPTDKVRSWWYRRYKDAFGMVCLSRSCTNPVMWAHYAARHQGMVLGFECNPTKGKIMPVVYRTRRVRFDETRIKDAASAEHVFGDILWQKYFRWRYEDEWRAYVSLRQQCESTNSKKGMLYFLQLGPVLRLATVIVGYAARHRIEEVKNALYYGRHQGSVRIMKAKLSQRGYRMRIEPTDETAEN